MERNALVIERSTTANENGILGTVAPRHGTRLEWKSEKKQRGFGRLTGLLNMLFLLLRPFLMWFFRAVESRGFKSSKLQRSSPETDMIAPQLSNSPQYCEGRKCQQCF